MGRKGRNRPSSVAEGFSALGSPATSESWNLAPRILQEPSRAFPRRSLGEFGPFSPVMCYCSIFLWMTGFLGTLLAGLLNDRPAFLRASLHIGMSLSFFHKVLNSGELHLLFHLKPLPMCDSPVIMALLLLLLEECLPPCPVLPSSEAQLKLHRPLEVSPRHSS